MDTKLFRRDSSCILLHTWTRPSSVILQDPGQLNKSQKMTEDNMLIGMAQEKACYIQSASCGSTAASWAMLGKEAIKSW